MGLTARWGVPGIESYFEGFLSAVAVFEAVTAYRGPYDAIVMAGFGEPGREGLRELVDVPVFDMTECSALMACSLGHRFSVVTTLRRAVPAIQGVLAEVGLLTRCASIRDTGLGVNELERDPERLVDGWSPKQRKLSVKMERRSSCSAVPAWQALTSFSRRRSELRLSMESSRQSNSQRRPLDTDSVQAGLMPINVRLKSHYSARRGMLQIHET